MIGGGVGPINQRGNSAEKGVRVIEIIKTVYLMKYNDELLRNGGVTTVNMLRQETKFIKSISLNYTF